MQSPRLGCYFKNGLPGKKRLHACSQTAPILTAEVCNEFLKGSQVTKVTFTVGHLRTQGLVES